MDKLVMVIAVWGPEFARMMLDYTIPSLLAPGNIPGLHDKGRCELHILTSETDIPALEKAPQIAALRQHIAVRFTAYPKYFFTTHVMDRYTKMSILHRGLIEYCGAHNAGILFLLPDVIWADGSLVNVERMIDTRHPRVIVMCTLRSDGTTLKPAVDGLARTDGAGQRIIQIGQRELVRLSLDHAHEETRSRYLTSSAFTFAPAHLYWPLGDDGLLARAAHLHPIFVHPRTYDTGFKNTFDGDFLQRAVPDPADYLVCDDSDLMYFTDLTEPDVRDRLPPRMHFAHEIHIADWFVKYTDPNHIRFLATPIWIHTGIDRAAWQGVLRQSDFYIQKLAMYYESMRKTQAETLAHANAHPHIHAHRVKAAEQP